MKKLISTVNLSREEWLSYRRKGIGGSDAASIVGLNPYKSAFEVWANKVVCADETPDNEAMRQGRDLEDYVARRFSEKTGCSIRRLNYILADDAQPYMIANVDRVLVKKKEGLECKTMNPRSKYAAELEENSVPPHYYVQCQWYMAVMGWDCWHLAILVYGKGFYTFEIERNEDDIKSLRDSADRFWNHNVLEKQPPPPDGSKGCHDTILSIYKNASGEINLDKGLDTLHLIQILEEDNKNNKKKIQQLKDQMMLLLGDAECGIGDGFRISAKTQTRRTFDSKRFAKEHPEIDLTGYYKETISRPFRYKIFEEE